MPVRKSAALQLRIGGQPVLGATIRALTATGEVGRVVLALDGLSGDTLLAAVPELASLGVAVGPTAVGRWTAIVAALPLLGPARIVLVQNADRPLLARTTVHRLLAADGSVTAAGLAVHSSIKRVVDRQIVATVPRESLRSIEGPWRFERQAFEDAVRRAAQEDWPPSELALARRAGMDVKVVDGEQKSVAVGSPADARFVELVLAEGLAAREPGEAGA